jgi:archaea-specific RecJ-like exonuclease
MKFKDINTLKEMLNDKEENIIYTIKAKVTEIVRLQQLTIFTIVDSNNTTFQLTKYLPGVVVYPEIKENCIVTFSFKRFMYQNKLQGQIADVKDVIAPEDKFKVSDDEKSKYKEFFSNEIWKKLDISLKKISKIINQAIEDKKPIILSHHADCDGYCGAMLLENVIMQKIKEKQPDLRYLSNYYTRNPSKTPYYDISDATKDISSFQNNFSKVNSNPLLIIVDNGSTYEDLLAIKKVRIFGADVVVIDHHDPGDLNQMNESEACKHLLAHCNPHLVGLNKNFSASLLCFRLAYLMDSNVKHSFFMSALGTIADRCDGEIIDKLVQDSNSSKEYLIRLAKIVNLEIFFTKYAYGELPLNDLLIEPNEKQKQLLELYEDQLIIWEDEVKQMIQKYSKEEKLGKFDVTLLDADKLTLWNDYYSIGKLTGFAHRIKEDTINPELNLITISISESMVVFRVKQDKKLFDGNKLIKFLQEKVPYSRVTGGGHDVAGSIKFISASKDEVLTLIKDFITNC